MTDDASQESIRYVVSLWDSKVLRYRYPVTLKLEVAHTSRGVPYATSLTLTADNLRRVTTLKRSTDAGRGRPDDPKDSDFRGALAVTKELLRDVSSNLNRLVDDAVASSQLERDMAAQKRVPIGRSADGDMMFVVGGIIVAVDERGREHELQDLGELEAVDISRTLADAARRRRASRRIWTDENFKEVAAVFRDANDHQRGTRQAVMDAMHVGTTQAGALIKEARNRGYLPPARRGRRQDS